MKHTYRIWAIGYQMFFQNYFKGLEGDYLF